MNIFDKTAAELFPTKILNKRAKKLLSGKPSGFHPVKKRLYRRECRELLRSYQNLIGRRREGRILGNKGISIGTRRRIEKLKKLAR
ncbi:MAG: hypothetical protein NC432_02275 [Roseburia sp.]|nr:hypothetical protein [Roseburia sp.]MCM1097482.1 hypothetical protein [Ruminococcus flavefaciens]